MYIFILVQHHKKNFKNTEPSNQTIGVLSLLYPGTLKRHPHNKLHPIGGNVNPAAVSVDELQLHTKKIYWPAQYHIPGIRHGCDYEQRL